MGFQIEEQGPELRLVTWINVVGAHLHVEPYQPNMEFVLGKQTLPKVSRCPQFHNPWQTPLHMLRCFVFAQLFMYDRVCGEHILAYKHVAVLVLECTKCMWPTQYVAHILMSKRLRHRSCFLDICLRIGIRLMRIGTTDWLYPYACMPSSRLSSSSSCSSR